MRNHEAEEEEIEHGPDGWAGGPRVMRQRTARARSCPDTECRVAQTKCHSGISTALSRSRRMAGTRRPGNRQVRASMTLESPGTPPRPGSQEPGYGRAPDETQEIRDGAAEAAGGAVPSPGWVKDKGSRVIVVFEGRDGAGKGGTIRAITERSARACSASWRCRRPRTARSRRCTCSGTCSTSPPPARS